MKTIVVIKISLIFIFLFILNDLLYIKINNTPIIDNGAMRLSFTNPFNMEKTADIPVSSPTINFKKV